MKILIGASRGRSEGEWHQSVHFQKLEIRGGQYSNTLTAMLKDNLVIEIYERDIHGTKAENRTRKDGS